MGAFDSTITVTFYLAIARQQTSLAAVLILFDGAGSQISVFIYSHIPCISETK